MHRRDRVAFAAAVSGGGERDYIRADALESIAQIDSSYARAIAPAYEDDEPAVARCARELLASRERLYRRSFASAFWHRHE